MNTSLDKQMFGNYIACHQVAWQARGGVMCVSHGVGSPSYDEISTLWNNMPNQLNVVTRDEMISSAFSILATWSREGDDVLLDGGENLLVCIPRFAYDKLIEWQAS